MPSNLKKYNWVIGLTAKINLVEYITPARDGNIVLLGMTESMFFSYTCNLPLLRPVIWEYIYPDWKGNIISHVREEQRALRQVPLPLSFHQMLVKLHLHFSFYIGGHGCWQWNKHYEKHLLSFFMSCKTEPESTATRSHDWWSSDLINKLSLA